MKYRTAEVRWITEWLPPIGERVLICREKEKGQFIVEQAWLTDGGWWKVYGTNCKKIVAWALMPEPPEPEEKE